MSPCHRLFAVLVAGLTVLGTVACGHPDSAESSSTTTPGPSGPSATAGATAAGTAAADRQASAQTLHIPTVGLKTPISPQGLRDGKVNPGPGQVIWFTGSDRVRPGAVGTSVIAGHVVSNGEADAFATLQRLERGDDVILTYPEGERLRLEVTSTDTVDKQDLTTNEVVWGPNDDTRRVVLITCDDRHGFREDGHRAANFVAVAELPS